MIYISQVHLKNYRRFHDATISSTPLFRPSLGRTMRAKRRYLNSLTSS